MNKIIFSYALFCFELDWLLDLCSFYYLKIILNNTDMGRDVFKNTGSFLSFYVCTVGTYIATSHM